MKKIITLLLSVALCFSLAVPAFATANGLDDETKADYYAEYIKIAQEVNQTLGSQISVNPIEEISDDDWMTPEEFREFIIAIETWNVVCDESGPNERSTSSKTKTDTISVSGKTYTISGSVPNSV